MSEIIVAKAGGTSNANAEAIESALHWAEQADIFVVSAPGKLEGGDDSGLKVTDLLLKAHSQYEREGSVAEDLKRDITCRYGMIAEGLGTRIMTGHWLDDISPRVDESVRHGMDAASMLGERLQSEVYESVGFTLLDPGRSKHDLEADPESWKLWMEAEFKVGKKYVLPGNTTRSKGRPVTFDRGGSDISGGLAAYGVSASLNLNLTDGNAMSADPRLIAPDRLRNISHMLYVEGRELGRNGTGLVHPAAMVPLMRGNIPTEIRSTFDKTQEPTRLDNDYERAQRRGGRVIALSLMKDITIHHVYEPGMAETVGRLADFDISLATNGVPIVDSQGDGVDGQKYFVESKHAEAARTALDAIVRHGTIETIPSVDLITMVGYNLHNRLVDNMADLIFNSELRSKEWQTQRHDLSHGKHSLRISVEPDRSMSVLDRLHHHFLESKINFDSLAPAK